MNVSGFFQFLLGFIIGIILFGGGIAGGAYYFLTRVAVDPADPIEMNSDADQSPEEEVTVVEDSSDSEEVEPEPEPEPEPESEDLPEGAYRATVTWDTGLILRAEPTENSDRVGGVAYDQELIILGRSDDNDWDRVRVVGTGQEAWVKAGNVIRID